LKYVLPYPAGNIHPRFWGWVIGTGTVSGAFTELLSASMNTNTGGLDHHSANHVEKQLILWLQEIFHFPASASGVLTSGEGQLSGIERADSLAHGEGGSGLTGGDLPWFSDYGFQLSRGFRALKAWMSLKEHGIRKYGRLTEQNILQARYLADLVEAKPELELVQPVPLNVGCFRYIGQTRERLEGDETRLDELNKEILIELQEGGIAVPSGTTVRGLYYFHLAITNHRSRREDFDLLLEEVLRIGGRLQRKAP